MKIALGIVFLLAGGSVAACDATFNFSRLPYSAATNADAGFGSTEAERQAAVYAGVAIYNGIPGNTDLNASDIICAEFKDGSTERYKAPSFISPVPFAIEGSLQPAGNGVGSGGELGDGGGYDFPPNPEDPWRNCSINPGGWATVESPVGPPAKFFVPTTLDCPT